MLFVCPDRGMLLLGLWKIAKLMSNFVAPCLGSTVPSSPTSMAAVTVIKSIFHCFEFNPWIRFLYYAWVESDCLGQLWFLQQILGHVIIFDFVSHRRRFSSTKHFIFPGRYNIVFPGRYNIVLVCYLGYFHYGLADSSACKRALLFWVVLFFLHLDL